ncbi:MAG TPA: PAS domain S-box protein [Candidatus Methylomirabilis sp.]|nr:PAS domain S-box protein [Candidatus Methylomirabilis sp.]
MKDSRKRGGKKAPRESSEPAEFHRALFEESADGIFVTDPDGRYVAVNPRGVELTGYSARELLGMAVTDLLLPEDPERDLLRKDDLRQGRIVVEERSLRRKDGSLLPVEIASRILTGGNKLGIARDITERRRSEERMRENAERLRVALSTVDVAVFTQDRDLRYTWMHSPQLGFTPDQVVGRTDADLLPSEAAAHVGALKQRVVRDGAGIREVVPVDWDGRTRYFDLVAEPARDPEGKVVGLLGATRDITDIWQAKEALRESEEKFRGLFHLATDGIFILDSDGQFLDVNATAHERLGYSREEMLRMNIRELDPPEFAARVPERLGELRSRGHAVFESAHVRKDGTVMPVEVNSRVIRFEGRQVFLSSIRDITDRRKAGEEQEKLREQLYHAQKMESVGRLAGGVAHDFNNMLGVILGYSELLLKKIGPESPHRGQLVEIRNAAQRSADLTRQLLAFARRQTVVPKVLDLNDTVSGMLKMLRRMIREDIDLVWKPGAGLLRVRIDPAQIDQVLANLCVNARDAIGGVGRITIGTENVMVDKDHGPGHAGVVPGDYVMVTVADDGYGMEKDVLDHVFEPFFTTKPVGEGTGLGLATVYGIVKQNDGFIYVDSAPGKGSTFRIYLPRVSGEAAGEVAGPAAEPPRGRGETLLLVEDEAAILDVGKTMLEGLGYAVIAVTTPDEALRLAGSRSGGIQLLLTDVVMPGMNGRELADRLREITPGLKCVFMSGYTVDVIGHRGVLDEGVRFLQKPFTLNELATKVREALGE